MEQIKWVANTLPKTEDKNLAYLSPDISKKVRTFHESFPQYNRTPLAKLDHMAEYLGLKNVFVKDESYRFGLNAFKVLGGSYAIAKYIAQKTGKDVSDLPYSILTSDELKKELGSITFYTATDGNHGRGVAWTCNRLHQPCVIHMPFGTTQTRLNHVLAEHATATIEELNYDDCVRKAAAEANDDPNGVIIQDTAWDGYEEIPTWIMQGYGTMAYEADEQMEEYGCDRPTHIFVQAGVGSLAGAIQASAGDGNVRFVDGEMLTLMNGLACGEPSTISWDILRNHVHAFVSCPDWVTAKGMRLLAAPIKGDVPVTAGESGAVTMGLLYNIMKNDDYKKLREELELDANSKVLMFVTEGDTDPDRYKSIVWDGENSLQHSVIIYPFSHKTSS